MYENHMRIPLQSAEDEFLPLEMLLDALPCELVAIDRQGKILFANQDFLNRYNLSLAAAKGRALHEVEESASLHKLLESTVETRLMFGLKGYLCCQSNLLRNGLITGAVQMCFQDDGKFGMVPEEPFYSHLIEDIHALFESNWDVIYATDSNGITLDVSSASRTIWGVEPDQLVGKSVYELEKRRVFYPSVARMVLETKGRVQAIQTTATGKKLLVLGTPIKDDAGNIVKVINTSRLIVSENELRTELETTKMLLEGYKRELEHVRIQEHADTPFISHSPQMRNIVTLALKVSQTDITVLITGESGVGKEVLASYIHANSTRKDKPYIKINCGAIPPTLLESELFGYEKGAFTGAERGGKPGIFELADKGTLFLDEIGEIPLPLQVKLLRALQENEFMRLGGTRSIRVDVRVVAATNKDLLTEVQKGTFRKDLYYRLNVVPIQIPPLRERRDDILPLSLFFLDKYNKKYGCHKALSSAVIERFMDYNWDGNIRELQNTVERIVVLASADTVQVEELPDALAPAAETDSIHISSIMPLKEAQQILERKLMELAQKKYHTTTRIAEALGVDQSTVSRKLRKE